MKFLETGPKFAPFCLFSGVSVCACGTVVSEGVETGSRQQDSPSGS